MILLLDFQNKKVTQKEFNPSSVLHTNSSKNDTLQSYNIKTSALNCNTALNTLKHSLRNNTDEILFAYFLWKFNLISRSTFQHDQYKIIYNIGVNFCNNSEHLQVLKSQDKLSQLEQAYIRQAFTENSLFNIEIPIDLQCSCLCSTDCELFAHHKKRLKFCPYFICAIINEIAISLNKDAEDLFEIILGKKLIKFQNPFPNINSLPYDYEEITENDYVNANSALAAAFLISSNLFSLINISNNKVEYRFYPLCLQSNNNIVKPILNFWNSPEIYSSNTIDTSTGDIQKKRQGYNCQNCNFEHCPDKIAAYVCRLAQQYNVEPSVLALCLAQHSTEPSLDLSENILYYRSFQAIEKYPTTPDSKKTFQKIISYIVNHDKNKNAPFIPFNLVIFSSDDNASEDISNKFFDAIWHFKYLPSCSLHHVSMAKVNITDLIKMFNDENSEAVFDITQFELIEQNINFTQEFPNLIQLLKEKKEKIIIVLRGEKSKLNTFLNKYYQLSMLFENHIEITDMPVGNVINELSNRLKACFSISNETLLNLSNFIHINYPASHLKGFEYIEHLYNKITFNHFSNYINADNTISSVDIPYITPPRTESDIFAELDELIGLSSVKNTLHNLADLVKFNIKINKTNMTQGLHMVFSGNAGTGKTTVANLVSEILFSIGFIKQNKCVVCSSQDLIAGYVGQTAIKTTEVCESAYDGVLFIDEAYMLNPYSGNQTDVFKEECVGTLIQQMENNRDRLVIIFAGYEQEMKSFIAQANTGLSSRIFETVLFPDYSVSELLAIFENIIVKEGLIITEDAKNKVAKIIENAKLTEKNFGNARFVRNLFEKTLLNHAKNTRLIENETELLTITAQDIS